jgi:hypothetical protein
MIHAVSVVADCPAKAETPLRSRRRKIVRAGALSCTLALLATLGSGSLSAQRVSAQTPAADDPVLLRELVERIAGDGYGIKAKLLLGTLPSVTPALAVPPGWRVIGAVVREISSGLSGSSSSIENSSGFVDAPLGSTTEAIGVLTKALTAGGWIVQNNGFPAQSGFVVANSPQPAYAQFCAKNVNLSVNALKEATGPVRVSLNVNTTPSGFPNQCGPSGSPTATVVPEIPAIFRELPRLVLPEKAVLVNARGGGGSQFSSSSGLTIDKADSPSVLELIFAPQMVDAGWQKAGGASTETASVTTWRKKSGETPLQATLLIVNAIGGDQRRDLTITVSQEAMANGYPGGIPIAPLTFPVALAPQTTIAIAAGPPVASAKSTSKPKASVKKASPVKSVKAVKK